MTLVERVRWIVKQLRSLGAVPELCDLAWKLCEENEALEAALTTLREPEGIANMTITNCHCGRCHCGFQDGQPVYTLACCQADHRAAAVKSWQRTMLEQYEELVHLYKIPMSDGWYWYRSIEANDPASDGDWVALQVLGDGGRVAVADMSFEVTDLRGQWVGPIEPPQTGRKT